MIKPIETKYKGYRFRSRLEARWAVFLDALNIRWEYEQEGFILSDNTKYLPDFQLPTFGGGMYMEVKPDNGDFSKALKFCREIRRTLWCAEGTPSPRAWKYYYPDPGNGLLEQIGIPCADQAWGENRMYSFPGYENEDLSIPEECFDYLGDGFISAVNKSRSARFEHGENHD